MLKQADLEQFYGSENFYRLGGLFPGVVLTEGAKQVVDAGNAAWLVTDIAACQIEPHVKKESMQVWKLEKHGDGSATLTCEDGNDNMVYTQHYDYTDFPLGSITIWVICDQFPENKIRRTMMLPSEY